MQVKQEAKAVLLSMVLLVISAMASWAQTYKLVKVTSVGEIESGKRYVFEQKIVNTSTNVTKNYVLNNTISSDALTSTNEYKKSGLAGNETYVWTLETNGNYYLLKNVSLGTNGYLLHGSSTNVAFGSKPTKTSDCPQWYFSPQNDGSFIIMKTDNRYLGLTDYVGSTKYKAYSFTNEEDQVVIKTGHITVYKLVEGSSEDVEVSSAGMATYVSNSALDYSNVEGLKAYKAKVEGNSITLTKVGQVPAGEGVLLKVTNVLESTTTFEIPLATGVASWADSDNDFITGQGKYVATSSNGNYNYILNQVGGVVGFYKANGQMVATNHAYLSTTASPEANSMQMVFDDEAAGISEKEIVRNVDHETVYNLAGQRVAQPTKGLYIVNGKKIVISKR